MERTSKTIYIIQNIQNTACVLLLTFLASLLNKHAPLASAEEATRS